MGVFLGFLGDVSCSVSLKSLEVSPNLTNSFFQQLHPYSWFNIAAVLAYNYLSTLVSEFQFFSMNWVLISQQMHPGIAGLSTAPKRSSCGLQTATCQMLSVTFIFFKVSEIDKRYHYLSQWIASLPWFLYLPHPCPWWYICTQRNFCCSPRTVLFFFSSPHLHL